MSLLVWSLVITLAWIFVTRKVDWTFTVPARRCGTSRDQIWGLSHDLVISTETSLPYLERWILWLPGLTLRVHKFWRGDDPTAPHDHPWWYVTFPLSHYIENWWDPRVEHMRSRVVGAWRFHFRPAAHRHIVHMPPERPDTPIYTLVMTGGWERKWGFWPEATRFIYWREWVRARSGVREEAE